jgi:hypothetical protein
MPVQGRVLLSNCRSFTLIARRAGQSARGSRQSLFPSALSSAPGKGPHPAEGSSRGSLVRVVAGDQKLSRRLRVSKPRIAPSRLRAGSVWRANRLGPGACREKRDEAALHAGGKTRDARSRVGADAEDGIERVSQWERIEHAAMLKGFEERRGPLGLWPGTGGWAGRRLAKLARRVVGLAASKDRSGHGHGLWGRFGWSGPGSGKSAARACASMKMIRRSISSAGRSQSRHSYIRLAGPRREQ